MPDEPLHTVTYTLTTADALAYEQAAARMTPLGTLALLCWLGLCATSALLVPPDWAGAHLSWSFGLLVIVAITIGYVLALLLMALRQWRRARRRVRRPHEFSVVEWPDRLDIGAAGLPWALPFSAVRRSILTPTHLFLESDRDPLILPYRAFPEEGSLEALEKRVADLAGTSPIAAPPPVPETPPVSAAALAAPPKPTVITPASSEPPAAIAALASSLAAAPPPPPDAPAAEPPAVPQAASTEAPPVDPPKPSA